MKRRTQKTIGAFKYKLTDHKPQVGEFKTYDAFFNYSSAIKQLGELEDALEAKPISEYHEDMGNCIWWTFPINEPPYCGTPNDCSFPEYATHFTKLLIPINYDE